METIKIKFFIASTLFFINLFIINAVVSVLMLYKHWMAFPAFILFIIIAIMSTCVIGKYSLLLLELRYNTKKRFDETNNEVV